MKQEYKIRHMHSGDVAQVVSIEQELFSQPWSADGFCSSLSQEGTIYLVAEAEGTICGYCGLLQALDEADITNVAVDPAYRNLGIAGNMLQELFRLGQEKGIRAFTLEVRVSNAAAIHLYEKLGFESAGIRKGFYDFPKEDAMIMWKYM